MIVKCNNCKKEFNKQPAQIKRSKSGFHYCSRSCAAISNNVGVRRNPPIERVCKRCSSKYFRSSSHRSSLLCKECSKDHSKTDLYKNLTLKEYHKKNSVSGKHPSWKNSQIRNFTRTWNKNLKEHPCQKCGYGKHIEFCHIKPISSFSENTKLKTINDSNNILILCRNCHWEFDHGLLKIEEIPSRH